MKKTVKNTKKSKPAKDGATMLAEKTFQDFNKEQPHPSDFKKTKRGSNKNTTDANSEAESNAKQFLNKE